MRGRERYTEGGHVAPEMHPASLSHLVSGPVVGPTFSDSVLTGTSEGP